ncbi:MAG: PhoH family protein [Spirochaetales bacterium]|nr:PhoH family protein [Spirochaetales bacterium]
MATSFVFDRIDALRSVCGINDSNIPYLEKLLGCSIYVRGDRVECNTEESGDPQRTSKLFIDLLDRLSRLSGITSDISEPEILMEYKSVQDALDRAADGSPEKPAKREFISVLSKAVYPKSSNQEAYIRAMNRSQITFGIGPAGTGKTYLAVAYCLGELLSGRKQKLILTRPVVEAGESLGFLPGDLSQKLNPYLKPLYDSMEAMIAPATIRRLEDSGAIEIAPLAYMRGRSIHNACIILDEAQNTTQAQMKMFLTRIGENSCAIITGDVTQIDLPKTSASGLVQASEILRDIEGIEFVSFTARDTVRSRVVQRIISAYEKN